MFIKDFCMLKGCAKKQGIKETECKEHIKKFLKGALDRATDGRRRRTEKKQGKDSLYHYKLSEYCSAGRMIVRLRDAKNKQRVDEQIM